MNFVGPGVGGRLASFFANWFVHRYGGGWQLARMNKKGYISPSARIDHNHITFGDHVFIGDRVVIYNAGQGGQVELKDGVILNADIRIYTGQGGSVKIDRDTLIEAHCTLYAYKASVEIGRDVMIGDRCAFLPFDHGILPGELIRKQPLTTKGGIKIGDDVWLGFGVIILSGVHIGSGTVIGAGSVVTHNIPDGAVAVGIPARVIRMRRQVFPGVSY